MATDTERLDFLLNYLEIEDIGDEVTVYGISINAETLEDNLSLGAEEPHPVHTGYQSYLIDGYDDDLRDVIDRAIESHKTGS